MPAPKTRREWKASEVKFLKANYPDQGGAWCAERLKRPVAAIHAKAVKLCLRRSHNANGRVESNPVIDAAIRHAYTKPADSGAIKQICKTFGVSSPWVARRGLEIGARTMRPPRRTWQPRELEIVEKNAQASAEQIAKALRAAGFRRSAAAVQAVKTANHFDAAASEVLRPGDIAKLFGVVPNAVKGWIKKGMLVPENPAREPGEFTIIREEAVARFIVEHPLAVNFPKLEGSKLWFIDLLVRKGAMAAMSKPKSQREAVLQAAQAHPTLSPRQIAELLEMDVRVARVVISKLRADGLLPSTREAA